MFSVQRDFRWKYPEYKCFQSTNAGSDIDLVADTDGDQVPIDVYNDGRAHITVVTFLHKRVFCPKPLVVNWRNPREKKAPEHMAHGRVLWLDTMTHEGERISIGGDMNVATSRTGYSISTKSHFEKVDNQFQNFIQRTGGSLT